MIVSPIQENADEGLEIGARAECRRLADAGQTHRPGGRCARDRQLAAPMQEGAARDIVHLANVHVGRPSYF